MACVRSLPMKKREKTVRAPVPRATMRLFSSAQRSGIARAPSCIIKNAQRVFAPNALRARAYARSPPPLPHSPLPRSPAPPRIDMRIGPYLFFFFFAAPGRFSARVRDLLSEGRRLV